MTKADEEKAREIVNPHGPITEAIAKAVAAALSQARAEAKAEGKAEAYADAARICRWFSEQNSDICTDYLTGRMHAGDALASHIEARAKEVANDLG